MNKVKKNKNGYITEISDENNNLIKEIKIRGSLFRYHSKHKTYNNVAGNELLHNSSFAATEKSYSQ